MFLFILYVTDCILLLFKHFKPIKCYINKVLTFHFIFEDVILFVNLEKYIYCMYKIYMFNVGLYGLYSLKFDISIECLRFCLNCEFAINIFSLMYMNC